MIAGTSLPSLSRCGVSVFTHAGAAPGAVRGELPRLAVAPVERDAGVPHAGVVLPGPDRRSCPRARGRIDAGSARTVRRAGPIVRGDRDRGALAGWSGRESLRSRSLASVLASGRSPLAAGGAS